MSVTPKEFSAKLDQRLKTFQDAKWFSDCAVEAHGSMADRIFEQGLNGANRPHTAIGKDYSVYSEGYTKKRAKKGRQTAFVNLIFEGRLVQDFSTSLQKQGNSYVSGVKNSENSDKVKWLEDLYGGMTWKLSKQEIKDFESCVKKRFIELLTK